LLADQASVCAVFEAVSTLPNGVYLRRFEQVEQIGVEPLRYEHRLAARWTVEPCIVRQLANRHSNKLPVSAGFRFNHSAIAFIIKIAGQRSRPAIRLEDQRAKIDPLSGAVLFVLVDKHALYPVEGPWRSSAVEPCECQDIFDIHDSPSFTGTG
jgi:hypothetical protein